VLHSLEFHDLGYRQLTTVGSNIDMCLHVICLFSAQQDFLWRAQLTNFLVSKFDLPIQE
jgi:hypothetical protein